MSGDTYTLVFLTPRFRVASVANLSHTSYVFVVNVVKIAHAFTPTSHVQIPRTRPRIEQAETSAVVSRAAHRLSLLKEPRWLPRYGRGSLLVVARLLHHLLRLAAHLLHVPREVGPVDGVGLAVALEDAPGQGA